MMLKPLSFPVPYPFLPAGVGTVLGAAKDAAGDAVFQAAENSA